MKKIVPNYYEKFICIADRCRHNCCIGWEIDIDDDTLAYYDEIGGELGNKLRRSIALDPTPHFLLGKDERCPFLDQNNLCEIISELGECGLCQICADHPRFYNWVGNRLEVGLGLCCEAAAKLILTQKEPTLLLAASDEQEILTPKEKEFLSKRRDVFNIIQDKSQPLKCRLLTIKKYFGLKKDDRSLSYWKSFFFSLERLDPAWDDYLMRLNDHIQPQKWEDEFEKVAVYLIYRHYTFENQTKETLHFILLSLRILQNIAESITDFEELTELTRLFSAEIEYSDENIKLITNQFC